MLSLSFQELFLRSIPEGFLFVFAVYTFSRSKIDIKRFSTSSILFGVIVYLIRLLPIQYGVHTILGLIVLIITSVYINKIDTIKAIQASIIGTIIGFVSESINAFILQYILKIDLNYVFNDYRLKTLLGIPSLVIFGCIVFWFYFITFKRKLRNILHGKFNK